MSPRETRREFDEIVGRLSQQDPSFIRSVRVIPRHVALTVLAVGGALVWAGLSILMVIWGAVGVVITCLAVAVALVAGVVVGGGKAASGTLPSSIRVRRRI